MTTIKLTAKRQATLPKKLCEEMHVDPGDAIQVEKRIVDGEELWCLKPVSMPDMSWFGMFKKEAQGKKHDMESIRKGIAKARKLNHDM